MDILSFKLFNKIRRDSKNLIKKYSLLIKIFFFGLLVSRYPLVSIYSLYEMIQIISKNVICQI